METLIVYGTVEITKLTCLTALAVHFHRWWIILFYILIGWHLPETESGKGNENE